jgi:hypothetical protein
MRSTKSPKAVAMGVPNGKRSSARAALTVLLAIALSGLGAGASLADNYTVGTNTDASATACPTATATNCSLRQLILYVEANPFPPDMIIVPRGTYTLALGALVINQSMSIVGAGASSTAIREPVPSDRSSMGDRVFDIAAVSGGLTPTVSITGVELAGGDANSTNGSFGGDIRSSGVVALTDDWITNGFACSGGGVGNSAGSLTIERSLISTNHAACGGGDSGGVENFGSPGSPDLPAHLLIDNSTIADNDARLVGGVFSWNDPNNTMTIENSTIADNANQDEPGGAARGPGGGLGLGSGIARVRNTILAGNVEITGNTKTATNCAVGPGLTSLGHNIDSGTDCHLSDTIPGQTDISSTNPKLGQLQNNGGPTETFALLAGSPALDRVPAHGADCPSIDERGIPRPQGSACDIGAFELQVPPHCAAVKAKTAAGGSPVTISLSCAGSTPGGFTYAIASNPKHGKLSGLSGSTGKVQYTPAKHFTGTDSFTYRATGSGGASAIATVTITVPKLRLNPKLAWTFGFTRMYTTVKAMKFTHLPSGAKIEITCAGKGCKAKSHTRRPKSSTVGIAGVFKGWRLHPGAKLTIAVVKSGAIGKQWVFSVRPSQRPTVSTHSR